MILRVVFILIAVTSFLPAQTSSTNSLTGKVIDSISLLPISNASVYLSGTTIGTVTDIKGAYKIEKIPPDNFQLVISMIGYSPVIQPVNFLNGSVKINKDFSLEPKTIEMAPILVNEEPTSEWKRNFQTFKNYLLGQTDLSDECTIENQNEIILTRDSLDVLRAKCSSPILVTNHALGYKIDCLLLDFYWDAKKMALRFLYVPKFTEMNPANKNQLEEWQQNREKEYLNSLNRFLLVLTKNKDIDIDYFVCPSNAHDKSRFYVYQARELDSQFWNEHISYQAYSKSYLLNLGLTQYQVINQMTQEKSYIYLPFGIVEIDQSGFPVDPLSIQIIGNFEEKGLANSLPRFFEKKQQD